MLTRLLRPLAGDLRAPGAKQRLGRFAAVGLSATGAYYAILAGLVELAAAPVLLATSIAFVAVCLANYALHHFWTFRSGETHGAAFPRFVLMVALGFAINGCVMFAGVSLAGLNYLLVQAAAIATVVAWNYLLSFYWVFRTPQAKVEA